MTILTSTSETLGYTPPWQLNDDGTKKKGASVFHLRAGSVIERGQMEAELSGPHRAGKIFGYELRQAVRDGVLMLLADDPSLDHLLSVIDAEGEGETEALTPDDQRLLVETRHVLAEHWPPYRDLVAQLERRREIAPIVALRRFCVGVEAKNVVFAKGKDGFIADATLARIDPLELAMAGNRAYQLQQPDGGLEGNSPRPSPSDDSPKGSQPGEPSTADGGSES